MTNIVPPTAPPSSPYFKDLTEFDEELDILFCPLFTASPSTPTPTLTPRTPSPPFPPAPPQPQGVDPKTGPNDPVGVPVQTVGYTAHTLSPTRPPPLATSCAASNNTTNEAAVSSALPTFSGCTSTTSTSTTTSSSSQPNGNVQWVPSIEHPLRNYTPTPYPIRAALVPSSIKSLPGIASRLLCDGKQLFLKPKSLESFTTSDCLQMPFPIYCRGEFVVEKFVQCAILWLSAPGLSALERVDIETVEEFIWRVDKSRDPCAQVICFDDPSCLWRDLIPRFMCTPFFCLQNHDGWKDSGEKNEKLRSQSPCDLWTKYKTSKDLGNKWKKTSFGPKTGKGPKDPTVSVVFLSFNAKRQPNSKNCPRNS